MIGDRVLILVCSPPFREKQSFKLRHLEGKCCFQMKDGPDTGERDPFNIAMSVHRPIRNHRSKSLFGCRRAWICKQVER